MVKYFIQGKGEVTLTKRNFLAQGGEGQIFVRGSKAYKVYLDPKKAIPAGKIQELSTLTRSNIIKPEAVLLDSRNRPVGYMMQFIKGGTALPKLFTASFKKREGITPDMILDLVRDFQETIKHIHSNGILVVDLNEMNYLAAKGFVEIVSIDVDSYQTPSFPATVIMESIRDRQSKGFDKNTDWFSWGIVSFQLFIGIHPYKGKHPKVKTLDDRMLNNLSVFNDDVGIPKVCMPFSVIPDVYLQWYKAVFEEGKRLPPPDGLHAFVIVQPRVSRIAGSRSFNVAIVTEADSDIIGYSYFSSGEILVTDNGVLYNGHLHPNIPKDCVFGVSPQMLHIVGMRIKDDNLEVFDVIRGKPVPVDIYAESIMEYDGRVYIKAGQNIHEITIVELTNKFLVAAKPVANVSEYSAQFYDGVLMQDLLGSWYASVFPSSGSCQQIALEELGGWRIIDAKYDSLILMVVAERQGKYVRLVFRFDKNFSLYDVRVIDDITYTGLNFIVLDSGLCLHINEDEELEVFSNKIYEDYVKIFDDPAVKGQTILGKRGTKAIFFRGSKLFKLETK